MSAKVWRPWGRRGLLALGAVALLVPVITAVALL